MRKLNAAIWISILLASAATAAPAEPGPNEVLINVSGMVCSFCAQGVEKSLGKLENLDTSRHRNGVFVDIDNQVVVLVFKPGAAVPQDEIKDRIRKAGYDPVAIHLGPGL